MNIDSINEYIDIYSKGLLDDVLPFWTNNSIDYEDGGFLFCLNRDGTVIDTDKSVWIHARFVWLLSTLYLTVEKRSEWLALAKHGIEFIEKNCFDNDGRMFFIVTKEGKPLRKRRYVFSEFFTVMAFAAYAKASGISEYAEKAVRLFDLIQKYLYIPGLLPPKSNPQTRQLKGLGVPMMTICACRELYGVSQDSRFLGSIDRAIETVANHHLNEQYRCVLENVGLNGEFCDSFDGRLITPGHGIEVAWFILNEALLRGKNEELIQLGSKMVDYCWDIGWDKEYGGIIYFRDAKGLPCTEYWHDMKFWWQQNEAIIATLLAYYLTEDPKHMERHRLVHDWAYKHFPDQEYGEWFGYLHRDGSLSSPIKGNMWKGPFHLPRMLWYCWMLLERRKSELDK